MPAWNPLAMINDRSKSRILRENHTCAGVPSLGKRYCHPPPLGLDGPAEGD